MPMLNENITNFCKTWLFHIYPLKDIEHQRKYWFDEEQSIISSYTDDTSIFLEYYSDKIADEDANKLLNKDCLESLQKLHEKVDKFKLDDQRLSQFEFEEALLGDPKWKEIVSLAQASYRAIELYMNEVKNDSG